SFAHRPPFARTTGERSGELDLRHPHCLALRYGELETPAARAGFPPGGEGNGVATGHAPGRSRRGHDLQPGALGEAAAGHRVETEAHGFGLDVRQRSNLQPHRAYPRVAVLARCPLDDFEHA